MQKVSDFALSPGAQPCKVRTAAVSFSIHLCSAIPAHLSSVFLMQVAVYVPGSKGAPAFVRLYQYPSLGGTSAALANKSFFKADKVCMQWNKKGKSQHQGAH